MRRLYQWDKQLASLLMLSFFLPMRMQVLILIPLSAFLGIRDLTVKRAGNKQSFLFALFLGSLYLLYVAYLPFTPAPYQRDLHYHLEVKASILLLPLMLACLHRDTIDTIKGQLHWFVIGCLLACLLGNLVYLIKS